MMATKPIVFRKGGKQREGRGFSRNELREAGTNPREAIKLRIPIDMKRKTNHAENVETLRTLLETKKAAVKTKKPRSSKRSKS